MTSIVTIDRTGRIHLPAAVRTRLKVRHRSRILVSEDENGGLVLIPLDVQKMAKRIREEMKGVDVDKEVAKMKQELRAMARKQYPELAKRMRKRA